MHPRILLIKPDSSSHIALPPLGLLYLAGAITKKSKNAEVKILDFHLNKFNEQDFRKLLVDFKPQIIGITAFSFEIVNAFHYCDITKDVNQDITTIIGGCHVSCFPEHVLSNKNVDYGMKGEAEISFLMFVDSIIKKNMIFLLSPG